VDDDRRWILRISAIFANIDTTWITFFNDLTDSDRTRIVRTDEGTDRSTFWEKLSRVKNAVTSIQISDIYILIKSRQ